MNINRKELLDVLQKIKPAIVKGGFVQSDSFIFDKGIIYSQNNELIISFPFTSEIKGAVRAQKLYDLLEKIKDDEIKLEQQENELVLKTQKTEAGLVFNTEIQREINIPEEKEFKFLPDNFIEGLSFSMFSTSKDTSNFPLNCLQIKDKNIIACDNHRLVFFYLEKEIEDGFLIPVNIANIIISYTNEINKYCVSDNSIYFKNESGVILSFKELIGNYPKNIEQVLNVEGKEIILPDNFIDSILRTEIISDFTTGSKIIDIEIEDNKILCKSKAEDGWIIETNEINYNADKIVFSINSLFLKEILKYINVFINGESAILFQHKNFKYITMKMVRRVNK